MKAQTEEPSMNVQLLIPLTLLLCVALALFINNRQVQQEREGKRNTFVNIKLRVSTDVLREYEHDEVEMGNELTEVEAKEKTLEEEIKASQATADKAKQEKDGCQGEQVGRDAHGFELLKQLKERERESSF